MSKPKATVYTAGYSGLTASQLLAKAEELSAIVVDIRIKPFARDPQFRQGAMTALLGGRYIHVGSLGNVNYKSDGPVQFVDEAVGLAQVEAVLTTGPVILLCGCWNVAECHRRVAAEALGERGYPVTHLERRDFAPAGQKAVAPPIQPGLF